ncbi:MAG: hypothetical protein ACJ8FY_00840 [Gemmataceae bacterium]
MRPIAITVFLSFALVQGCHKRQDSALAAIERIGGRVQVDEQEPGRPIVEVDLHGTEDTDAMLVRLKDLTDLRRLDLGGTDVSDAGLSSLEGMLQLRELNLSTTKIGDEGLSHLAELKQLRELGLGGTRVTNAGLAHLGGLKRLERVNLAGTKVTEEGINRLRKQLPELNVQHSLQPNN